jgi:hypothetical protein
MISRAHRLPDIRPGAGTASAGTGKHPGGHRDGRWHRRRFVTAVADLHQPAAILPNVSTASPRTPRENLGEPSYSASAVNQPSLTGNKYQVGLDFLWKRDY